MLLSNEFLPFMEMVKSLVARLWEWLDKYIYHLWKRKGNGKCSKTMKTLCHALDAI
jgi:hypothetical protein